MTFPTITFKQTNVTVDRHVPDLVAQKLLSLEKFIGEAPSFCEVEFERVTSQQSGDIYRIEVNLEVNGKLYRAEATMDSFEKAVDEVRDELDKELRRARDKEETLLKRGGRRLKELLRFGRSNDRI